MKTLLLIFIFTLSLKADFLITVSNSNSTYSYCVYDFYIGNNAISFTNDGRTYTNIDLINFSNYNIDSNYYKNSSYNCIPKTTNYNYLGLTENQFNISMAFYGIFLSSLIAFGLIKAF